MLVCLSQAAAQACSFRKTTPTKPHATETTHQTTGKRSGIDSIKARNGNAKALGLLFFVISENAFNSSPTAESPEAAKQAQMRLEE